MAKNKTLEILHLVEFYYPNVGGSQIAVQRISEGLVTKGHDVTVATSFDTSRLFDELNGVKIKQFDITGNSVRGITGSGISDFRKFLKQNHFDVIMAYNTQVWTTDLLLEELGKVSGKKVLVPVGFSEIENSDYAPYYRELIKKLERFSAVIFLSKNFRDVQYVRKHKVDIPQYTIYNGASEHEFGSLDKDSESAFRKKYNIPQTHKILLCVANFTGEKGQPELLKSFMLMPKFRTTLVLIGSGTPGWGDTNYVAKYAKLFDWLARLSGKRIVLLNYGAQAKREDVVAAYAAACVFVLPSHVECSPLTLIEAMASRIPFISTDTGNASDLADEFEAGVITKTYKISNGRVKASVAGLAASMFKLLSNRGLRQKMGQNGHRIWLEKLTWSKIADQYEKVYRQI